MSPDREIISLIPALRGFARTFLRNQSDADDLVQETLIKGLSKIQQFEPGTSMKSWLFTIMRNTFYTRARLARREAPGLADDAALKPAMDPTQEWSVRCNEISSALERLPTEQREIIVLIGALGMSYEEAAQICCCAIGTVKSRLNRARHRLLAELGETSSGSTLERCDCHPVGSMHGIVKAD